MRGQLIQKSKQLNLIQPNYSIKGHINLKSHCGIGLHTADDIIKLFKKSNSHLRNFSTNNKQVPLGNLRAWQVTDSEGAFTISISGKSVKLEFKVTQKEHSAVILNHLQKYFDCGSVVVDNRSTGTLKLRVSKLSDILDKIITHFENFPCLTSKALNFQDWKKVALLMKDSQHFQGLEQIKTILKNMNKNRTFEDKYNYCVTKIGFNGDLKIELPSD
jgi:acetolactate synthase regulatory subunit